MANQTLTLTFQGVDETLARIGTQFSAWPQFRQDAFTAEWVRLEEAGAELADFSTTEDGMTCRISDDFIRHCQAYGLTTAPSTYPK